MSAPAPRTALWQLGFRPFFLAGAALAVIALLLWLAALWGGWPHWSPRGGSLAWHRHEMVFGFAGAVIAGFLLTAVQNWTGRPGLSGRPLQALVLLWLAARVAMLLDLPDAVLIPVELAFLPLVALAMLRSLWPTRQFRQLPIIAVLLLLTAADLYSLIGPPGAERQGALAALWLIAVLMALIGGRVIPFFTQRGLGLAQGTAPRPLLDAPALLGLAGVALLQLFPASLTPHPLTGILLLGLAGLHGLRMMRWYHPGIWQLPLLWSLYLAYAWLVLALALQGLWYLGLPLLPGSILHALAAGGLGGLILAMMSRVSLGHTGRPLQPPRGMTVAFLLLNLGTLARVLLPVWSPQLAWLLAGLAWCLAFGLFLVLYGPMLVRPRVDGRPG